MHICTPNKGAWKSLVCPPLGAHSQARLAPERSRALQQEPGTPCWRPLRQGPHRLCCWKIQHLNTIPPRRGIPQCSALRMPIIPGTSSPEELTRTDKGALSPASSDSILILHCKTESQNRLILLGQQVPKATAYSIHEMLLYPSKHAVPSSQAHTGQTIAIFQKYTELTMSLNISRSHFNLCLTCNNLRGEKKCHKQICF